MFHFDIAWSQPRQLRLRQRMLFFVLLAVIVLGVLPARAIRSVAQTRSALMVGAEVNSELRIRKNVMTLTGTERREFVDAILALKQTTSPYDSSFSYYDQFVQWHKERYFCHADEHMPGTMPMPMIHTGPMFLPWHREFLRRFENALREVSGKPVTVPYWDWTDSESVNPNNPSAVFRGDFMGGAGSPDEQYAVTTGPFKKGAWTLYVHPDGATWAPSATAFLTRKLGLPQSLPKKIQVETVLGVEEYDVPPFNVASDRGRSFRNALEGNGAGNAMRCGSDGWMALESDLGITPLAGTGPVTMHNLIHGWVGGLLSSGAVRPRIRGTMVLPTAPNDPVFFLHHANVDRLWATWQAAHAGKTYEPTKGHAGNNADSAMAPFVDVDPRRVENISDLGYRYR